MGFENFVRTRKSEFTLPEVKKAAVAERAIKHPKNNIYRYMDENGDKYIREMDSFLSTMKTKVNLLTGKAPKM